LIDSSNYVILRSGSICKRHAASNEVGIWVRTTNMCEFETKWSWPTWRYYPITHL